MLHRVAKLQVLSAEALIGAKDKIADIIQECLLLLDKLCRDRPDGFWVDDKDDEFQ